MPLEAALDGAARDLERPDDRGLAHAIAAEALRRLPDLDGLIDRATRQRLPDDAKARFTEGRLKNVERRIVEASYMDIAPKSVDLAVIVMAYHDAYWIDEKEGWPAINTDGFVESIKRMLKPGGKLLIVDHNAAPGTGKEAAGKLHRLNEDWAKKSLTSHGFVFEKSYDGLRNPNDQLDKMVYDPAVKGKTDRYVHLYLVK